MIILSCKIQYNNIKLWIQDTTVPRLAILQASYQIHFSLRYLPIKRLKSRSSEKSMNEFKFFRKNH